MSNVGQAALIVVGTVVGAYFGAPQLGFALGAIAGSVLFPTQLPPGPQLKDNRTTTASVGEPIPLAFGTCTVSGTVIWLAPYVTNTNEAGAKGGPEQLQYSYTQSIAIGLAESPIDAADNAIAGILRIWENGTIVYDVRPQQPADTALDLTAETDQEYANRLTASAAYAETFTLYLGTEEQLPDPTIEATQGVGNVPAYRGLAYIVYPNRQLQLAQGWRHPTFKFEIYTSGVGNCTSTSQYSNWVLYPWGDQTQQLDPRSPYGTYGNYQPLVYADGGNGAVGEPCATLEEAIEQGGFQPRLYGWAGLAEPQNAMFPWDPSIATNPDTTNSLYAYMIYNALVPSAVFTGTAEFADFGICEFLNNPGQPVWWAGAVKLPDGTEDIYSGHGMYVYSASGDEPAGFSPAVSCNEEGTYALYNYVDGAIQVERMQSSPTPICAGLPAAPITGYCVLGNGDFQAANPWVLDTTNEYLVLATMSVSDITGEVTQYPLNPCLPAGSPNNNQTFWENAYNAAVEAGTIPSGYTYGHGYPVTAGDGAWVVDSTVCTGLGASVSVAEIISALCARAGLTSIDVSDMESISVSGYSVSSLSSAADAITPLRSIAFFDAVESGTTLRFQSRGKPIVATLTTDQIGAYDGSSTSDVPPSVSVERTQDEDLPRQIRLKYKSVQRDYEDNEQDSPFRLTTTAVNDEDIDLPICLDDTQALQAAQILWADAWAGRNQYKVSIDQSLSQLEVGDPIAIPDNGFTTRVRITADSVASGVLRQLTCVSDDSTAYTSTAVAAQNYSGGQRMVIITPTMLELLDLPALQDTDNNAGFYVAAARSGTSGNTWKGCQVYRSLDGGSTWTLLFGLSTEATIGSVAFAVPASEYFTWDDETVITVNVPSSLDSFESRTDEAVLAGANAAAMGADGRWEIVQFANAAQVSDTQWQLSRLLRGRRGTEHNIGLSREGDAFVMISTGDLNRVQLNTTQIGAALTYDAPSVGSSFSSGTEYPFTGRAMALRPFSPVDVEVTPQSDGDLLISWTRRDRLGGTLMSGVDMPCSDLPLTFSIDIQENAIPNSPETIMRTLTSNTTSVLYTQAMQSEDSGEYGSPRSFRVAVYQISQTVGRGFPGFGEYFY
jgi:hypothetical protein